jgi:SAM-dependent methyltransferase
MRAQLTDTTFVTFKPPTFPRLLTMLRQSARISVLRCLEYERLAGLELQGFVLDFGGGNVTNYREQLSNWTKQGTFFRYESANIDPQTEPTFLLEPNAPIPCEDNRYDAALSLNTFEHIYDVTPVLRDLNRVLKEGGKLVFIVPFIFRVHGHPSDFSRHTPAFWRQKLAETGFEINEVEALHWGPFSAACTVTGIPGPFKKTRLRVAIFKDFILSLMKRSVSKPGRFRQDHPIVNCPLGYLVTATKNN